MYVIILKSIILEVSSKYCYVFKTEISPLQGVLMEPLGENNVNNNVETMAADHIQTEINPLEPLGKNHPI